MVTILFIFKTVSFYLTNLNMFSPYVVEV